jgi:hypothetical protein
MLESPPDFLSFNPFFGLLEVFPPNQLRSNPERLRGVTAQAEIAAHKYQVQETLNLRVVLGCRTADATFLIHTENEVNKRL